MKKRILSIILAGAMVICIAGCGQKHPESASSDSVQTETSISQETQEVSVDSVESDESDEADGIEVNEGLFTVEITLPADYVGEVTQEELNAAAEEKGFKSITLNEDGSATYLMTKKQHEEMLAEIAESINASLDEMVNAAEYSFTAIKANDNFTDFTVTTSLTELGLEDSMSVLQFYIYGGMYSIFSGEEAENIHVSFINEETGAVISEANSNDIAD